MFQTKSHSHLFAASQSSVKAAPLQGRTNSYEHVPEPESIKQSFSTGILANQHKNTGMINKGYSNNSNDEKRNDIDPGFKCNKCKKSISGADWKDNNVRQITFGTNWRHDVCPDNKAIMEIMDNKDDNSTLYNAKFVSSKSQYSMKATGSCTINALEAALQLQMGQKPSVKLVDDILGLAALYKRDKHTSTEEIYPNVTRYKNNLEQVDWTQITTNNLKQLIDKLTQSLSISAIITKPPETIFMHFSKQRQLILYDSHPRTGLDGSHFLVFDNIFNAKRYLQKLWPYQHLGAGFDDLSAQRINMCEITLFKLKKNANPSLTPDLKQMGIELKKIGVSLEAEWHKNYANNNINNNNMNDNNNEDQAVMINKFLNQIEELKKKLAQKEQDVYVYKERYKAEVAKTTRLENELNILKNNGNNTQKNPSFVQGPIQQQYNKEVAKNSQLQHQIALLRMQLETKNTSNTDERYRNKTVNNNNDNDTGYYQPTGPMTQSHSDIDQKNKMRKHMESKQREENKNKNKNVKQDKTSKESKESDKFYCDYCSKFQSKEEIFEFSNCKCKSCRQCAQKYFKKELNKKRWPIICSICKKKTVHPNDFMLFPEDIQQKYYQLSQQIAIESTPYQCPGCQEITSVAQWKKYKKDYIQCPTKNCKFTACPKCDCEFDIHYKLTCDDAKKIHNDPRTWGKCGCNKLIRNLSEFGNNNKYQSYWQHEECGRYLCFICGEYSHQFGKAATHASQHKKNAKRVCRVLRTQKTTTVIVPSGYGLSIF